MLFHRGLEFVLYFLTKEDAYEVEIDARELSSMPGCVLGSKYVSDFVHDYPLAAHFPREGDEYVVTFPPGNGSPEAGTVGYLEFLCAGYYFPGDWVFFLNIPVF